jgi:hypothetical protein
VAAENAFVILSAHVGSKAVELQLMRYGSMSDDP